MLSGVDKTSIRLEFDPQSLSVSVGKFYHVIL